MLQCHYECLLIKWKTDFKSRSFLLKNGYVKSPDFRLLIHFNTALSINSAGQRNACVFIFMGNSVIPSQISNIKVLLLWLLGQGTHRSLIISLPFHFYFKVTQLCLIEMPANKAEQDKHLECQGVAQYAARQLSLVLVESCTKNASSSTFVIYLYWCDLDDYQYWLYFFPCKQCNYSTKQKICKSYDLTLHSNSVLSYSMSQKVLPLDHYLLMGCRVAIEHNLQRHQDEYLIQSFCLLIFY